MATNPNEESESRGTLISQYKSRRAKRGPARRCGPYVSLVLRIDEYTLEWIYLGRPGSRRYQFRLDQARSIMADMPEATNAEIAAAIRSVMKDSRWMLYSGTVISETERDEE